MNLLNRSGSPYILYRYMFFISLFILNDQRIISYINYTKDKKNGILLNIRTILTNHTDMRIYIMIPHILITIELLREIIFKNILIYRDLCISYM